jgi:hypothetical protein
VIRFINFSFSLAIQSDLRIALLLMFPKFWIGKGEGVSVHNKTTLYTSGIGTKYLLMGVT